MTQSIKSNRFKYPVVYAGNYPDDMFIRPTKDYIDSIKIVIYTPPLDNLCGGISVLHNLAKTINDLGNKNIKALIYHSDNLKHKNEFCNDFFNPFWLDDRTIVVYPEKVCGNPLMAKNVVRWILLDLGFELSRNYYQVWNRSDLVYHWEPSSLPNTKQLVNIWVNPMIKQTNKSDRHHNCFGFKKVKFLPKSFHKSINQYHSSDDICIDDRNIEEVVDIFNSCKFFYCYDPNTFLSIMAPLCGCVTVLHPMDGIDKEQYFKSRILYHKDSDTYLDNGIAYGNSDSEIQDALDTITNISDNFTYICEQYKSSMQQFLDDIQQLINKKSLNNTVENIYYE